jgi:MOSC domain-containing protein YiiM
LDIDMKLLSINTSRAQPMMTAQGTVMSAIGKTARNGAVAVKALGLEGDEQADLSVHGGLEKAVYLYPYEHYPVWQNLRSQALKSSVEDSPPLPMGMMGENLTLQGLLETQVWIGDKLRFENCTLVVSEPRQPCFKFNIRMGFKHAAKMMVQSGYCGFYCAVLREGSLIAGEAFTLEPGPRELSVHEIFALKNKKARTQDLF